MKSADRRRSRRGFRSLLVLLWAIAIVVPAGVLTVAPVAAADPATSYPGTIAPGVHVGSIDLGGMDEATARQALTQAFASAGQGQVVVTADDKTTPVSYASFNRHVDIDALIADAFGVGRSGNAVDRILSMMHTMANGMSLTPKIVFDEIVLGQRVAEAAYAMRKPYVNAKVVRTATGFNVVGSQPGVRYDSAPILPGLISQLYDPNAPASVTAPLPGAAWEPSITQAEAEAAAAKAMSIATPLVLANGGQKWTVPAATVRSWIYFKGVNGALEPYGNESVIAKSLATLSKDINREPVSASWQFGPKGVVVVPAKTGRKVDIPATAHRIAAFLAMRGAGTVTPDKLFGPTVTVTQPALTTADATKQASKFKLLSTWTTYFQPAAHNGYGANIWVPAGYLDNQVVQPGQTFSFWDRVGEVSLARGYRMGGAIVGGHTQEGVALAGGICSTSTTLFNAALRAGLKMGERSNHYYYITRYPVGLDATVSKTSGGGGQNMTFTNDTKYPVLIKSFKTGGSVTFSLYGIPTGRTVTFSKPVITNYVKATSEVVPVSTLPTGRVVRIEYPDDGFNSSVTAFVRDANGKLISDRTYFSHYSMVKGVQYIGNPAGKPIQVPSYAPGAQGG